MAALGAWRGKRAASFRRRPFHVDLATKTLGVPRPRDRSGSSGGSSGVFDAGEDAADGQLNACAGVTVVPAWSGTLTLDYTDQATTVGMVSVAHSFRASFTLVRDPAALPGQITVNYLGTPTGTGTLDETVATASSTQSNQGSGAISSIGNMVLTIDGDTCTFHFEWECDWHAGISYSAGFPTYGAIGGTGPTPDYYTLVSDLGYYLFVNDMSAARGPGPVVFTATPDTTAPDQ